MQKNIPTLREKVQEILDTSQWPDGSTKEDSVNAILSLMSEVVEDCVRAVENAGFDDEDWDEVYDEGNVNDSVNRLGERKNAAVRDCAKKYKAL